MAKAKHNEVLTPEIIEELPLEKVIENSLVANNVTDTVIAAVKEKYKDLRLVSVDDKESYLELKSAYKEIRGVAILAEKCCKAGRENAIKIQKLWIAKERDIVDVRLGEVLDPIAADIKKYDDHQEQLENERLQRQEESYMQRQAELLQMGAVWANGCFNLNDVSYEANLVKESDDDVYQNSILPKFKIQYEKNNAAKVEEDRVKAEQEEFQKQKEEFQKQKEEFQKQKEEAEKQQLQKQLDEAKLLAEEKILKDEAENKLWRGRLSMMDEAGWNSQFAFSRVGDEEVAVFTYEELITLSEIDFTERLNKHNSEVKQIKEDREKLRQEKIENEKQAAIEKAKEDERLRIEEENKQKELQRQQDEARKLEEAAKASDKEKWQVLLSAFNAVSIPTFTSNIYKGKLTSLKEKLQQINTL